MKKLLSFAATVVPLLAPMLVLAQPIPIGNLGGGNNFISTLTSIVNGIGHLVRISLPIVFGLAILAFFWGIFRYVFAHSMDDKISGRGIMLWSLIAIFVMASLYGIVTLMQVSLGISSQGGTFTMPRVI
jgi:hypothetical protein